MSASNNNQQAADQNCLKLQSKTSIFSSANNGDVTRMDSTANFNASQGQIQTINVMSGNKREMSPAKLNRQKLKVKINKTTGGEQSLQNVSGTELNGSQQTIESPILGKKKRQRLVE